MEWSCGLPLAAWTVIILLLDGKVLGEMRLVCKAWTIHCDQNIVKLFLSSAGPITDMAMRRFLRKFPQLQEVLINEENYTWGKALDSLPKSLTCLYVDTNARRSDSCDFFQALAGFTALTTLHLWGRFDNLLGLEGLSSLKSLCLSGTRYVLGDGAFRSLSGLTNLTYLDLTNCHKLSPTHGFATLACFTGLTSLNLAGTMANNTVLLETVSTLSALAHLEINNDELENRVMISTTAVRDLKNILPGIRVWKQRFGTKKYLGFRSVLQLVY